MPVKSGISDNKVLKSWAKCRFFRGLWGNMGGIKNGGFLKGRTGNLMK